MPHNLRASTFPICLASFPERVVSSQLAQLAAALANIDAALLLDMIHRQLSSGKQTHQLRDGTYWTYATYDELQASQPWLSRSRIARVTVALERHGFIVTSIYAKLSRAPGFAATLPMETMHALKKTKWYFLDVAKIRDTGIDLEETASRS